MFPRETKILVLDDMPGMRQIVKGVLKQLGFTDIKMVENGKAGMEALIAAADAGAPFQLVLSDWNMPVMSGLELLRFVREEPRFQGLPFLLVTAEGEFRQVKAAMTLKVTEYVVKPFTAKALGAKLESAWKKTLPNPAAGAQPAPLPAPKPPMKKPGGKP